MHQIVALVLDQGIRLAQEDIIVHDRTVDILRSTGREDRLESQGCEARTEEYVGRVLCPETRHAGICTAVERVVSEIVFLLHIRLYTDKGRCLITACSVGGW